MINGLKYCDSQICENSGRKARTSSHQGLYYNRDRNAALNIYIISHRQLVLGESNRGLQERGTYIEKRKYKYKLDLRPDQNKNI